MCAARLWAATKGPNRYLLATSYTFGIRKDRYALKSHWLRVVIVRRNALTDAC